MTKKEDKRSRRRQKGREYLDTGGLALVHGARFGLPGRADKRHESQERETILGLGVDRMLIRESDKIYTNRQGGREREGGRGAGIGRYTKHFFSSFNDRSDGEHVVFRGQGYRLQHLRRMSRLLRHR